MAGRSGGHYRLGARWWQYGDEVNVLLDPVPPTPMRNLPDPLASKYPTLMQISEHMRRGSDCKHEALVNAIEWALRHQCRVTICA
jgi:hypothetical protein